MEGASGKYTTEQCASQLAPPLTGQPHVLLIHQHPIPFRPKLGHVKVADRYPGFRESNELWPIEARGVVQDSTAVDDRDRFVSAEEDLIW